eukprot:GHVT01062438.1.p3 GENE.GHVT01062438.1~~GHVT01062438.1.p3  ORF type:complete len:149 (+),score=31.68 GHVT01062438.1:144-590(+)
MAAGGVASLPSGLAGELIFQGAEARLYRCRFFSDAALMKHRFSKAYRHPALDASLTGSRLAGEGRSLLRSRKAGVDVPAVYHVDASNGILVIEWVDGPTVKELLQTWKTQRRCPQVLLAVKAPNCRTAACFALGRISKGKGGRDRRGH